MGRYEEIDPAGIRTYSAADRQSRVKAGAEAVPPRAGMTMRAFLDGLPAILKAEDLKAVARDVVAARRKRKPVIAMIGGHVIKTGCSPVLADLVSRGFITHLASNGAAAIHDTELARFGHTSEDVAASLADGSFGMAADTAELVNTAARQAMGRDEGFGEAVGRLLLEERPPFADRALIARCYRSKVPYTLHVALGTDIVHQHPSADGAAIGAASMKDFRTFCELVARLEQGVYFNVGSAVILPEVFLKALSLVHNLGRQVQGLTTIAIDFIRQYRVVENVVRRPTMESGKGYYLVGQHEILLPLLIAGILARIDSPADKE
jgi:hypothetical protein